jgi:hypothetical protein
MVSIGPETSGPAEGPVDSLRKPDGESLEAPRERPSTVRLDDHVDVVGLHRKVKNPESAPRALREAAAEDLEETVSPQRWQ